MFDLNAGAARSATPDDFFRVADAIGCDVKVIWAVWKVEAAGDGYFRDGRLKIRCEKRVFLKSLPKEKQAEALRLNLAAKTWRFDTSDQNTTEERYDLFRRMLEFDEEAAWLSVSYGGSQIMGFNANASGFETAADMFYAMRDSEAAQLDATLTLMQSMKLQTALKKKDWLQIAKKWNGTGQAEAYARAMHDAFVSAPDVARVPVGAPESTPTPKPAPRKTPTHKPLSKSRTMWTSGGLQGIFVGIGGWFTTLIETNPTMAYVMIGLAVVGILATTFIMRERIAKFARGE